MNKEEFKQFIESIGFKHEGLFYDYKSYRIDLIPNCYNFWNGSGWLFHIKFTDDLTQFNKYFKKELRSIKLKQILK